MLFGCLLSQASTQVDRAGLSGTVTDSAGRVVPGVHVVVTMPDTGLVRETYTSHKGTCEVPDLPLGACTVTFTGNGFAALTFDQVVQTVGSTRTLDAKLHVAGGEERMTVSASSALMDRSSSAVTGLIERTQAEASAERPQLVGDDCIRSRRNRHRRQQPAQHPFRRTTSPMTALTRPTS